MFSVIQRAFRDLKDFDKRHELDFPQKNDLILQLHKTWGPSRD